MENLRDEYADGTPRPKGFEYHLFYDRVTERYTRLVEHSLVCDAEPYPKDIVCIGFELFGAHQLNITTKVGNDTEWHGAPFAQPVAKFIESPFTDAELKAFTSAFGGTDEDNDVYFEFGPNDIVAMDAATGKITYRTKNGEGTVTLTKQAATSVYNTWMDL